MRMILIGDAMPNGKGVADGLDLLKPVDDGLGRGLDAFVKEQLKRLLVSDRLLRLSPLARS